MSKHVTPSHSRTPLSVSSRWLLVSLATFFLLGCGESGYQNIDGQWCYVTCNAAVGREEKELGVDAATFVVLRDSEYAKDRNTVFHEGFVIEGADAPSFEVLDNPFFAKDKTRVYVRGLPCDADPDTYELIKGPYGKDKSRVYCGNVPMDVQNVGQFEVVYWNGVWCTCLDKTDFVFHYGKAFDDLEISSDTPAIVGYGWARDGAAYYCGPTRVEDADYASFKVIDRFSAADKNQGFHGPFPADSWPQRRKEILGRD